ncbi:MAG: hypothetical protein LBG80_20330 [Bacteroidales bacterium]|jgi:hypothetical protein|nr:hypothetical protein [Bacteroidales bacterium]
MKQKKLYILFILFYATTFVQAQNYASLRLQMLGEMMPARSIPNKASIFSCTKILYGKMFTVNYNEKGEIEHLGVSLFSNETKELINKPICNFIERILLDLLLHEKQGMLQNKLNEFRITLANVGINGEPVKNLSKLLNTMKEPVQFKLNYDNKKYQVLWFFENLNGLEMTFPANRELIFGTNKVESDSQLSETLPVQHCIDSVTMHYYFPETSLDSIHAGTGFYVRKGSFFMLKQLNNDQLCRKDTDNRFYPVFDARYPEISLKNLLLTPQLRSTLKLHIKHRMYGRFTPEFTMSLNDFTCFFQGEFESFCYVDRTNKGLLEATLVLHNRQYNYIHMLFITANPDALFNPNSILEAGFSTNIPQDNIKSLF